MAFTKATLRTLVVGTAITGATVFGTYKLHDAGKTAAEAKAADVQKARDEKTTTSPELKASLAARKSFGLFGQVEKNAKDSAELSKMVAGYVAAGKTGKVLGLINKNAYVFAKPEDYLAVAATLSKSLGESGSMWFFEDSGMGQKRNKFGAIPGFQSRELTVEAATVYALALSMDKRMDERFLRLGFATFIKHLEGRPKAVNGMIALYWGFREAVEISCRPLQLADQALLAPKESARVSLPKFLSTTVNNAEAKEEYRAMAAKLLLFSDDAAAKAASEEYLKTVTGKGKRLLELIEKFEAERRANLLDS
jgi:hypothetical protein